MIYCYTFVRQTCSLNIHIIQMIRKSIYSAPKPQPNLQLPQLPHQPHPHPHPLQKPPQIQQRITGQNSIIEEYLNTRRVTKDKCCLIIFILYCLGLVIMMGVGLFYGNYGDLGYFVNDGAVRELQVDCNALYVSQDMTKCTNTCASNFTYLGRVCINNASAIYNPMFTPQVEGIISMYGIKYTFPMIIYVSGGLLVVTAILFLLIIYIPKIIYLYIATLFFMLLGMAFYLLKNFQLRTVQHNIQPGSIFYTNEQSTRFISFFLLGIYLLIFPFVLFSPKKIQLSTYLIGKLYQFYRKMWNSILFTGFVVVVAWCSLIAEIFLVMNFYTAGTISPTPQTSMFHTYTTLQLSHPASLTFHFIGVFWFYSALISWHKYFISSSMCLWYFQDSQSLFPIKRGLKRSMHHIGSAALDGILMPIQWLFMLLYSVFKTNDGREEEAEGDIHSCLSSCFGSFSRFFITLHKLINRNSPNSAVLTNKNYLQSCQHSAQIFTSFKHKFFNIGGTLTIFLTLFICVLWIIIMYFILYFSQYNRQYPPVIGSVVLPVFCVFVVGLVVGSLFGNLFTEGLDCLLFCYLMERGCMDGGIERKDDQLKIKVVLDQCYYKSEEQAKTTVFIYQQRDDNTFDITYVAKKQ